ncbi:MAG TPA: type I phosphomannose isomerase catalytic subunit [Terriglobales bacterium]|jgi:mannose-6-phosphate isomerase|nr:type I phosphomannose isomerase catalytic subunit [Terriglobales bacterium]
MNDLYPLLMSPIFDPRPWGATDLSPIYPNHRFDEKIGESWLTGDNSKVANGHLRGRSLAELTSQFGKELVGDAAPDPGRFPLLLKFLFPHEKLSVQVHPDDEAARRAGEPCGKTECWYVAHAKPGAQIGLGLKPGVTRTQLEQAIQQQRAEELLNWINVFPGEMIYVAGGTVHTLGPGSIIAETQQQSDTTYRLYDYGRPRELHLKEGLAAVKERVASGKVIRPAPTMLDGTKNRYSSLVASPFFVVEMFELKDPHDFLTRDDAGKNSVQILVAVEGCAVIEARGAEPVTLAKGDAVVVAATVGDFHVRPQWTVEFLKASLPGTAVPEPATRI